MTKKFFLRIEKNSVVKDLKTEVDYNYLPHTINEAIVRKSAEHVLFNHSLKTQPIVNRRENVMRTNRALSRTIFKGFLLAPGAWFHVTSELNYLVKADLMSITNTAHNHSPLAPKLSSTLLFINVLPSNWTQKTFFFVFKNILNVRLLSPNRAVGEINEQNPYNPFSLLKILYPLQAIVCKIVLDDVEKGSSALRNIVELEPDLIKVDRSLVYEISKPSVKLELLTICSLHEIGQDYYYVMNWGFFRSYVRSRNGHFVEPVVLLVPA